MEGWIQLWIFCNEAKTFSADIKVISPTKGRYWTLQLTSLESVREAHQVVSALSGRDFGLPFLEQGSEDRVPLLGDISVPVSDKKTVIDTSTRVRLRVVLGIVQTAIRICLSSHSDRHHSRLDLEDLQARQRTRDSACCVRLTRLTRIGDNERCVAVLAFL